MRLLGLQEGGHGTDLGLDRLSDVVDKHMMASTGNMELSDDNLSEEGSMISNLPLLFADGYPTSLEEITLPQLERFITFMVQCSFGHDTAKVVGQPQWWPKEVAFSNPFIRPKKINENWIGNLKKLVFRCYTYHRSEYLLRFCSYLALYPRDKLQYVNNWDSTTSLYHKGTGKLLVTFRNENMNYDKKVESPRRSLLPRNIAPPGSTCKTKQQQQQQQQQKQQQQQQQCHQVMVHPPCDDIYLCDNCDAEFVGLQKMQEHEKTCCDQERTGAISRPETPDPALQLPQTTQNQFLEYFHLCSRDSSCKPKVSSEITIAGNATTTNVDGITSRTSRRIRGSVNLTRCPTIPFSSPAGIFMVKKSKTMTEVTQQERLERIERHLCAPPLCAGSRPRWLDKTNEYNRWIVTYKSNRDKPNKNYVHEYKFNNLKEKPVLSIRSQLLYMACRSVCVLLTRLTDKDIVELKRDISKYQCPSRKRPPRARPRSASMNDQDANKNTLKRKLSVDHNPECSTPGPSSSKYRKASSTPTGRSAVRLEVNVGTLGPTTLAMTKSVSTTKTPDCIPLINLCSSDEEDDGLCPRATTDENREPERRSPDTAIIASSNFLDDLTQSRYCASPNTLCVDWLTNRKMIDHHEDHLNNVNDSDDNCGKKCISETVLNTCSLYPPMLKQTP
ncbi:uncharacterized protein LOC107266772 [Cephus cinctus]|uniref:Uncharacterized protein LOC107266772 n=1 Tax=Cephus cinctus TaxID=211228 RepID=A0AAJ7BTD0_CEPCN|nr:uncharacterized protein LOC107266772 [Cephus cinctus]XP_015593091.1 uncharacterized protein LOC107266772 [Cephus cinctus]XP_015593092.1 uncharacterized protein LOC107266772 [Cephus cinctus]XP_015593093.1 uncharacterized protein LOC107266772 [Cephus cinctus]XP_015593094.1 uncharacterized protein LOC107266772 [Cephus cinctus]XP_024939802.1 uncharacterized protein LOC107266772 [Cephus cinctus]XP_024939804.1 uncharacterized protein LOC107266772 [Cephus cinctus]XP_024939805.1 uncharacterized p